MSVSPILVWTSNWQMWCGQEVVGKKAKPSIDSRREWRSLSASVGLRD